MTIDTQIPLWGLLGLIGTIAVKALWDHFEQRQMRKLIDDVVTELKKITERVPAMIERIETHTARIDALERRLERVEGDSIRARRRADDKETAR